MLLPLLELRAARGRFVLMGTVVLLVAALVGTVSGFTTGLTDDTVSALRRLPATHVAFSPDAKTDQFARSLVDERTLRGWRGQDGLEAAPLGVSLTRGTSDRGAEVDMAAFGVEPGSFLDPGADRGAPLGTEPDGIVISQDLVDEGLRVGDTVVVDRLGIKLPVTGVTGHSAYGHVPVAYLPVDTWQRLRFSTPGAPAGPSAEVPRQYSAIALRADDGAGLTGTDRELGTRTVPLKDSYAAAPGYSGERITMTSIQAFLYVIGPLVVGSFFSVWTVQRQPELALLRALGASRRRLLGHTLLQAGVVVVAGTAAGGALAAGIGLLVGGAVPFSLPAATLLTALAAFALVGLAGTALTLRRVTRSDPMTMLGANR
ncbi:ABC transporter permease [Wenjunlia vitaminophila]|uniref:ABC transporter permease n=1 Tax=Wenjunlia vitaminophila TaxID=76728 RepID=A0A0T6LPN3_WENVI|nr:ABC transporter permease [Wenjunlia vitaminophila]KRV48000.1 ABC transporter permease [Wenjunlia vitaminophila]